MDRIYGELKKQACAWYMFADVCSNDRTDHVDDPETRARDYGLTIAAQKAEEAANAEYDSDEDDPFQWLMEYAQGPVSRLHRHKAQLQGPITRKPYLGFYLRVGANRFPSPRIRKGPLFNTRWHVSSREVETGT